MHHLQQSFPTESECEGLRVELNASKKRQHSLEQQQAECMADWLIVSADFFFDEQWEKRDPGGLGYIGDEILCSYVGVIVYHDKDP